MQGYPRAFNQGNLVRLQGAQVLLDLGSQHLPTPERRLALLTFRLLEIG